MVGQFFVRINLNVFNRILRADELSQRNVEDIVYDPNNPNHNEIIDLFQRQMNYKILATNKDIFYSLMQMYAVYLKSENIKDDGVN